MPRSFMDLLGDPPAPMRQDHWPSLGIASDQRAVRMGIAVTKRQQDPGDLGHYVFDRTRAGDILPGLWWPTKGEGVRPTGAWRDGAWPAMVTEVADDGTQYASPLLDEKIDGGTVDDDFMKQEIPSWRLRPAGSRVWVHTGSDTEDERKIVLDVGGELIAHWRGPRIDEASSTVVDCLDDALSIIGTPYRARLATALAVIEAPRDSEDGSVDPLHRRCQLASVATAKPDSAEGPGLGYWPVLGGDSPPRGIAGTPHMRVGFAAAERSGPLRVLPSDNARMGDSKCGLLPAGPLALDSEAIWYHAPTGRTAPFFWEGKYPGGSDYPNKVNVHLVHDAGLDAPWISPTGAPGTPVKGRWRWVSSTQFAPADPGTGGSGGSSSAGWLGIQPATSPNEIAAPAYCGVPAPNDVSRWVGGVPSSPQPMVWRMETIAASYDRVQAATQHWVYALPPRGSRYAGGVVRGGVAFCPPDRDELTRDATSRGPVDVTFAATGGAALAVCDRLSPTSGAPVSGLQIRRASTGTVQARMVDADGDADYANALQLAAFLTLSGGINVAVSSFSGQDVTVANTQSVIVLTPGGANRAVTLPAASACTRLLLIAHGGGANQVQIAAVGKNLVAGQATICFSDGSSTWYSPTLV